MNAPVLVLAPEPNLPHAHSPQPPPPFLPHLYIPLLSDFYECSFFVLLNMNIYCSQPSFFPPLFNPWGL